MKRQILFSIHLLLFTTFSYSMDTRSKEVPNVRLILQRRTPIDTVARHCDTPSVPLIHDAVTYLQVGMLCILLTRGADANARRNEKPTLPLSIALYNYFKAPEEIETQKAKDIVKILLENGANLKKFDPGLPLFLPFACSCRSPFDLTYCYKKICPDKYADLQPTIEHYLSLQKENK